MHLLIVEGFVVQIEEVVQSNLNLLVTQFFWARTTSVRSYHRPYGKPMPATNRDLELKDSPGGVFTLKDMRMIDLPVDL